MTDPAPALALVVTRAGLARFAAAQMGQAIDLTIAMVGVTDQAFVPAPTLTALPGEHHRLATVSGALVGGEIVHLTVRDDPGAGYGVRGFGLFLADGTLFALYGQAGRIVEKSAQAALFLALDVAFPLAGVDQLTFGATDFLNPPATETTAGVLEIATAAETAAGTDDRRAVSPKKLAVRLADVTAALLAAIADAVGACIPLAQRAAPNGVATLDAAARVPAAQLALAVPVGTVALFFGAAAPAGWAICDGQSVSRSDGSGQILTPDLRGRVAVGVSADHALGATFGQATANIVTASAVTGITLAAPRQTDYAGNGSQGGVRTADLVDPGHTHAAVVDVIQPSLALHYMMKV